MNAFFIAWASALPKGVRSHMVEAAIVFVYYITVIDFQVKFGN